ncbi:MAG: hypothetical protein ACQESR_15180 [Planctomycetota bacterium]
MPASEISSGNHIFAIPDERCVVTESDVQVLRTESETFTAIRALRQLSAFSQDVVFQAAGCVRMERRPTQAVLPLVGLAANKP